MVEKMKEYNKLVARHKKAEAYLNNPNNDVEKYLQNYEALVKEMQGYEKYLKFKGNEAIEGFDI